MHKHTHSVTVSFSLWPRSDQPHPSVCECVCTCACVLIPARIKKTELLYSYIHVKTSCMCLVHPALWFSWRAVCKDSKIAYISVSAALYSLLCWHLKRQEVGFEPPTGQSVKTYQGKVWSAWICVICINNSNHLKLNVNNCMDKKLFWKKEQKKQQKTGSSTSFPLSHALWSQIILKYRVHRVTPPLSLLPPGTSSWVLRLYFYCP